MTASTAPQAIPALLARVRAATGPDQRLNWDVWWYCAANNGKGNRRPPPEDYERDNWRTAPRYTESVDEAIALAERVLPGWQGDIEFSPGSGYARLALPDESESTSERAATPALALLAAIISALIAKEQSP